MSVNIPNIIKKGEVKWRTIVPKNFEYVKSQGMDLALSFKRTIYIPFQRLIVISG